MIMFNFLSLISGFCEIGIVVWGMKAFGITSALLGTLCYQVGNLVPNPIKLSRQMCWILLSSALAFGLAGFFQPVFLYPALTLFTMVLQNKKALLKKKDNADSKCGKRLFRSFGFALGFAFRIQLFFICIISVLVICIICKGVNDEKTSITVPHFNKLDVILILHEIHYFVYCYCVFLILYSLTVFGKPVGDYAALAFTLSWIPYALAEKFIKRKILGKLGHKKTFVLGHSILTVFLIAMFLLIETGSRTLYLISLFIWLCTGIFGATELCIGKIDKLQGTYVKTNHDSAENLGHILGVVLSIVLYLITKDLSISVLVAGAFASAALLLMAIFVKEEQNEGL